MQAACPEFADDVRAWLKCRLPTRGSGLAVKTSWLSTSPGSAAPVFDGLFATRTFKAGDIVCKYEGAAMNTVAALRMAVEDKGYLMRLGPQSYVDARSCPFVSARYINDCINPAGWNVRFDKLPEAQPPCALVVALRDVLEGEELFVDYGKWYWAGCSATLKPYRIPFGVLHALREACNGSSGCGGGGGAGGGGELASDQVTKSKGVGET